jgi:hypothetical protein
LVALAACAAGCGRGDAPSVTGSWNDAADGMEITLLSDGVSIAGTGVQEPNQPFRVYGNDTSLVFLYPDGRAGESFNWSEVSGELLLQGLARTLVFTRE